MRKLYILALSAALLLTGCSAGSQSEITLSPDKTFESIGSDLYEYDPEQGYEGIELNIRLPAEFALLNLRDRNSETGIQVPVPDPDKMDEHWAAKTPMWYEDGNYFVPNIQGYGDRIREAENSNTVYWDLLFELNRNSQLSGRDMSPDTWLQATPSARGQVLVVITAHEVRNYTEFYDTAMTYTLAAYDSMNDKNGAYMKTYFAGPVAAFKGFEAEAEAHSVGNVILYVRGDGTDYAVNIRTEIKSYGLNDMSREYYADFAGSLMTVCRDTESKIFSLFGDDAVSAFGRISAPGENEWRAPWQTAAL